MSPANKTSENTITETAKNGRIKIKDLAKFPGENPNPVLRISERGQILYSNRASWRLLKKWKTKRGGKIPRRWQKLVADALESNRRQTEEIQVGRQNYSFSIVPVQQGNYVNLYGTNTTEQKQAEQKLLQERASLKENITKQTAELQKTVAALQEEVQHRIETEKALKRNEERLTEALRIADLGNWEWDVEHDTLWWSEEVYNIFGVSAAEFKPTYKHFLDLVHPDDVEKVDAAVKRAMDKKQAYNAKHRIILPDGRVRVVVENAKLIRTRTTGVVMIGTCRDITEQVDKQQQLAEQAQLLNLAHDSIIVHDLEGRVIFWSAGAERTYGYTRAEAIGKTCHNLLRTKFPQSLTRIIGRITKEGSWDSELVHKTKDGKEIIVESRWVLRRDSYGNPTGILEIGRDITKRKAAEQDIEQARIYAESIIDTIQEALVVLDPQLRIRSANNSFYRTFGLESHRIVNKHLFEIDNRRWNIPELRKLLEEILPKNTSLDNYEFDYQGEAGREMKLCLNARRIYRREKKTELILLAIRDVTVDKQRQQQLRDLTEQLLMAEEKQRQLVASALHDSLGQTLAFCKRELGTLGKVLPKDTREPLSRVRKEINKAILHTRQLTTNLSPPALHTFGLAAAIEEALDEFAAENKISYDFNGVKLPINKDVKILLYRAVKELLTNIARHAGATKVKVRIVRNNEYGLIEVKDNGKGFAVEKLPEQVSKKRKFGLFSIRQRLDNLGGRLDIESKKKHGTRIEMRVPLEPATVQKG